jgi:hypothetical protein
MPLLQSILATLHVTSIRCVYKHYTNDTGSVGNRFREYIMYKSEFYKGSALRIIKTDFLLS